MSTVQIVGIAVASAIVLALVIILTVQHGQAARDAGEQSPPEAPQASPEESSFLDGPPRDELAGLGRAEPAPAEEPVRSTEEPLPEESAAAPTGEVPVPEQPGAVAADETHVTEEPVEAAPEEAVEAAPEEAAEEAAEAAPEEAAEAAPEEAAEAAPEEQSAVTGELPPLDLEAPPPGAAGKVPLSDIIVTTSHKLVDLGDPEVRRMLADLVKYEIDQATEYRRLGQHLDAVLQLTEAEKVCRALGMETHAERIHAMIEELQV